MKASGPAAMFDLGFDPSHGAGQPPQGDLQAVRSKRLPYLGAAHEHASVMRNPATVIELRAPDTQSDRSIV
jgi:hypothetical protein